MRNTPLVSLEICGGAGGQALGLEQAGFEHLAVVEIESAACQTLRLNRPKWNVIEGDVRDFSANSYRGAIDLLAGGVPCPPFSKAGKQLGENDERDLFPAAIRLIKECRPRAVMLENVRGLLDPRFESYRKNVEDELRREGYQSEWRRLDACHFGVPQLRPRVVLVGFRDNLMDRFEWPTPADDPPQTVGDCLFDLMRVDGWRGASRWRKQADGIAPTLVGGSKKHGGPDLGPTRAKKAWAQLGVDGHGLADAAPAKDFSGFPKLTVRMAARIQGFDDTWSFFGRKTAAYRQVGNAFPPPVARAVGQQIAATLQNAASRQVRQAA